MELPLFRGRPGVTFQKFLHPVKGFVGDDCLMGIGDAHPFVLRHSLNLVYLLFLTAQNAVNHIAVQFPVLKKTA